MKGYNQDILLALIQSNVNQVILTNTSHATHAGAVAASLASITVAAGDFSIEEGDTSGRKLIFAGVAEADEEVYDFTGGSANVLQMSFYNSSTGVRFVITDLASVKAVNDGDPVQITALDILELRDTE